MEVVGLLVVAAIALAIGMNYGQRRSGQLTADARTSADAVVGFLQVVNQRLGPDTAAMVRGVAWEAYDGDVRDYMQKRLREQPVPPSPE